MRSFGNERRAEFHGRAAGPSATEQEIRCHDFYSATTGGSTGKVNETRNLYRPFSEVDRVLYIHMLTTLIDQSPSSRLFK